MDKNIDGGHMTRKVMLVVAVLVGLTSLARAQQPLTKSASVSATATIQAIDKTSRMVTLKDEKGVEDTVYVGQDVKRFDELNVGDKVKITYTESLVLQLRKPGDPAPTSGDTTAVGRAVTGPPAGAMARQQTTTVEVLAIDQTVPSITVKTADGRSVVRKVQNVKNLEGVKVGDKIDITYTQAVALEVEPVK
jgi:hypothetical protein